MNWNSNCSSQTETQESPKSNAANCMITTAAEQTLAACASTRTALQQLRDHLIGCQICPAVDKCDLYEHFNLKVDQSLAEINDEWGW